MRYGLDTALDLRGVCALFGEPPPAGLFERLAARRFNAIRTSIHRLAFRTQVIDAIERSPFRGVYIIRSREELFAVPRGSIVELGQEPQLGDTDLELPPMSARQYAEWVRPLLNLARALELVPVCGAPSEIAPERMRWLSEVLWYVPEFERVAVHIYPFDDSQRPERSPYGTSEAALVMLRTILNGRRYLVSEFGNEAIAYWDRRFPFRHRVSEAKRLAYLRAAAQPWLGDPQCDGAILYQVWKGLDGGDGYGAHTPTWDPLPALNVWR